MRVLVLCMKKEELTVKPIFSIQGYLVKILWFFVNLVSTLYWFSIVCNNSLVLLKGTLKNKTYNTYASEVVANKIIIQTDDI